MKDQDQNSCKPFALFNNAKAMKLQKISLFVLLKNSSTKSSKTSSSEKMSWILYITRWCNHISWPCSWVWFLQNWLYDEFFEVKKHHAGQTYADFWSELILYDKLTRSISFSNKSSQIFLLLEHLWIIFAEINKRNNTQ